MLSDKELENQYLSHDARIENSGNNLEFYPIFYFQIFLFIKAHKTKSEMNLVRLQITFHNFFKAGSQNVFYFL